MTRKLFWLFLLIGWPCLAWGQGGRFDSVAQKNVQNFLASIPGASIAVCPAGATGTPCSPLVPTSPVTLCTDATCSTAAPNPFTADGSGNFGFYAIPGNYVYSITAPGVTGKLFNVVIPSVTPINLATQVSGTLPGANMAAVNLATSGNGGVTGTLPGANYAAVNLAAGNVNGGATGVLPGANMAATNLAGGNNPGGVTGTLPLANLTTQGTDTNLLTSGTVSASTGVALCLRRPLCSPK